jgi:hypothetical protein
MSQQFLYLIFILISGTSSTCGLPQVLPLHTSWTAATKWRLERKVYVLLRVQPHNETGDIYHLLANPAWKICLSVTNITTNMGVKLHNDKYK